MDTTKLDALMKIKKKGEASKSDKNLFGDEWLSLIKETGFDDVTESYLYEGFSFQGIAPFVAYIEERQDKQSTINKLLSGKLYYKNKAITFKMIINLLALLLLKLPEEKTLISLIIRRLPELSINKENKRVGDITKSIDKYFIQILNPNVVYPELNSLELKPAIVKSFSKIMSETISELLSENKISPEKLSTIAKIEKWLPIESSKVYSLSSASEESKKGPSNKQSLELDPKTAAADSNLLEASSNKKYSWQDGISILTEAIKNLEKDLIKSQLNCNNFNSQNEELKKKCTELENSLSYEQTCNDKQKEIISQQINEINILKQKNISLEKAISEKEGEIAERIKMTDMLTRDRTKQSDEVLKRLAAKLRIEYQDYLGAESVNMDIALGENMRNQLKTVFDVLNKNGIILD